MKPNFKKNISWVLVVASLVLTACGKEQTGSVRIAGSSGGITNSGQVVSTGRCSSGQSNTGKIYDLNGNSSLFEQQVKSFISATLDPQEFGTISGVITDATGVDMVGIFKFDSNGALIATQSSVLIKIFDSYTKSGYNGATIPPYTIEFGAAFSGSLNAATNQFTVKFKDTYGEITFQGQYDNSSSTGVAEGIVSYINYKAVTGYSPSSGTLGAFKAYTCALISQ